VTSHTHPLTIAGVEAGLARIGISPCPGCSVDFVPAGTYARDMAMDVARIADWGIHHVVCLLDNDTIVQLGADQLEAELTRHGIRFWHLPYLSLDDATWFNKQWRCTRETLIDAARRGESILLHSIDLDGIHVRFAAELLAALREGLSDEGAGEEVQRVVQQAEEAQDALRYDL
jgi:hypothetical protein